MPLPVNDSREKTISKSFLLNAVRHFFIKPYKIFNCKYMIIKNILTHSPHETEAKGRATQSSIWQCMRMPYRHEFFLQKTPVLIVGPRAEYFLMDRIYNDYFVPKR